MPLILFRARGTTRRSPSETTGQFLKTFAEIQSRRRGERFTGPEHVQATPSDLAPDKAPGTNSSLGIRDTDMVVRVHFTAPADAKYAYVFITVFGDGLPGETYGVTPLL